MSIRHVKVRKAAEFDAKAAARLLEQAVNLIRKGKDPRVPKGKGPGKTGRSRP